MLPLWLFVGLFAAVLGSQASKAKGDTMPKKTKIPLKEEILRSARKWAEARNLPLEWVLATIMLESSGKPNVVGDSGKSYGLMQIHVPAHGPRLAKHGITDFAQLFDVDTNIKIGTEIMRDFLDIIVKLKAAKKWPNDLPEEDLIRVAFKGGKGAVTAVLSGSEPYKNFREKQAIWHDRLKRASEMSGPLVT
jgi:hypothetical protein